MQLPWPECGLNEGHSPETSWIVPLRGKMADEDLLGTVDDLGDDE